MSRGRNSRREANDAPTRRQIAAVRRDRRSRAADAAAVALWRSTRTDCCPPDMTITGTARSDRTMRSIASSRKHALDEFLPEDRKDDSADRELPRAAELSAARRLRHRRHFAALADEGRRHLRRPGDLPVDRAVAVRADDQGLESAGLAARQRPHRPRKAARLRSRLQPRDQRRGRRRSSPRTASSGSTIISARKPSRTSSRCASAIRSSSRCGTRKESTTSRSPIAETVGLEEPRGLL